MYVFALVSPIGEVVQKEDGMNRSRVYRALRAATYRLPHIRSLYWICRRYVDDVDGVTNCDMHVNGELQFLERMALLLPMDVAFDVGSNTGDWGMAAAAINPKISLHCFEPGRTAFQRLASRDLPPSAVFNNVALGSKRGATRLHIYGSDDSRLSSVHPLTNKAVSDSYEVPTETVTDYCADRGITRVDYLKIDVEGHELAVLRGAEGLLSGARIRAGQFEYGRNYIDARVLFKDVFELLSGHRYSVHRITPRGLLPIDAYRHDLEDFRNANYAFLAPDVSLDRQ